MNARLMAAVLAALLALGLGVLFLMPGRSTPAPDSAEVVFLQQMIQHHQQATEMAGRIRTRAQNRTLRSLALDIQLSQEEQMRLMRGWLKLWQQPQDVPVSADHARRMGMASSEELSSLNTLPVPQAEVKFVQLMLRHHQGALAMVQPMTGPQVRQEVRILAQQMGITQGGEIHTMRQLLARLGGQPLPFPPGSTSPDMPAMPHMPGMEH